MLQRREGVAAAETAQWPWGRNKDIVADDDSPVRASKDEGRSEPRERHASSERADAGKEEDVPVSLIDPMEFALARSTLAVTTPVTESARSLAGLEPIVEQLVRAVAWSGDRRRGAARIELGGSSFGGAKLWIESDGNALRIELDAPPGVDASLLAARLTARLEARGLQVAQLRVL